jgi:hypothetical protein
MTDAEIKRGLLKCIPLALLAILIPIGAICSVFKPELEPVNVWFQRSGSLAVFFAVWIEYVLFSINDEINPTGYITSECAKPKEKFGKYYSFFKGLGVVLALWGTIIWGYGDLL